jgi:hypothetical protein
MNVLFDDGLYLDRALLHKPEDRYNKYSEAFQFYKPIDKIWGDFQTRDREEERFAHYDGNKEIKDNDEIEKRKLEFKDQYFLKQIPFIEFQQDAKPVIKPIDWQNLDTIDISELFSFAILNRQDVIGIAFSIYKSENVNINGKLNIPGRKVVNNREITSSFYLALRLVTDGSNGGNDALTQVDRDSLALKKINCIDVNTLIGESWNPRVDFHLPNDDNKILYRIAPTLVLKKRNILNSPNYTGGWGKRVYDVVDTFVAPIKGTKRMVMRIGRENDDKYILFLHGNQETGCPSRIPND